jgi:hypothetical protein
MGQACGQLLGKSPKSRALVEPAIHGLASAAMPGKTLLTSGVKRAPGFTPFSWFHVQNRGQ